MARVGYDYHVGSLPYIGSISIALACIYLMRIIDIIVVSVMRVWFDVPLKRLIGKPTGTFKNC